jgi:ubiquinone/menaquinone biosynthesis C-methylase UbiE
MSDNDYISALSFRWLTPLYDPLLRWAMQEERFKRHLIRQADIQPGHRVLDVGCGTGTLTLLIQRTQPAAQVTGLDGDPAVLAIARRKTQAGGVTWVQGMAYALPYAEGSLDRVVTSLVLHHLTTADKRRALAEVYRVLRPGGELHVLDFGPPRSTYGKALMPLFRHLEQVADNLEGRLPEMFAGAGFTDVAENARFVTVVGDLALYRISKRV